MILKGYPPGGGPALSYLGTPTGSTLGYADTRSTLKFPATAGKLYTTT